VGQFEIPTPTRAVAPHVGLVGGAVELLQHRVVDPVLAEGVLDRVEIDVVTVGRQLNRAG
jgi:hypothetical protein